MKDSLASARGYYPGDWVRPRHNPIDWIPLVDLFDVFTGNASHNRQGTFEVYDPPIGVKFSIEEATKSGPLEFTNGNEPHHPVQAWTTSDKSTEETTYHLLYSVKGAMAYATSKDSQVWTCPNMGLIEANGSKSNNYVAAAEGDILKSIYEDPLANPEERFRGIGCAGGRINSETGKIISVGEGVTEEKIAEWWANQEYTGPFLYKGPKLLLKGVVVGWTSPDRINWKRSDKILANFPMDGGVSARYDNESGYYYAYCRLQGVPQEQFDLIGTGAPEVGIFHRAIGITMTKDPTNWPAPKLVLFPDGQDDPDISFYGADYFPYPGRSDLHCLLVQVYHQVSDHVDTQIAFSRDGLFWQRPERKAIIPVGKPGSDDSGMVSSWGSGIIELPDGSWGSVYGGTSCLHNMGDDPTTPEDNKPRNLQWAKWLPHRFCSMEATTEGRFTIPTITKTSNELRLNYECKPGGWVKTELIYALPSRIHSDVDPVPGFSFAESDPLTGSSIDRVATWDGKSDISSTGDMVAIRIKMFRAKIFAYKV